MGNTRKRGSVSEVTVDMGAPGLRPADLPVEADGEMLRSYRMRRSPPSICTVTSSSVSPFSMHAITLAQAPVPHAQVSG